MLGGNMLERAFAQQAMRRAAGSPVPAVLVGEDVTAAWLASLYGRSVVRSSERTAEDGARAYLEVANVRALLETALSARVAEARLKRDLPSDRTPFERGVWLGVSRDALLAAGDLDGQLLLGSVFAGEVTARALHALAACARILGEEAPPILLEGDVDLAIRNALTLTETAPSMPLAVATTSEAWRAWSVGPGREHAKAMVRPFVVEPQRPSQPPADASAVRALVDRAKQTEKREDDDDARSAAERLLFEALERAPRSCGLFALNRQLDVKFGNREIEIDLACVSRRLAIEVDGHFHFRDFDCYRRDRRKDVVLQRERYFVMRFLAEDIASRLDEIVSEVHSALTFLEESKP